MKTTKLIRATSKDFEKITDFYRQVTEKTADIGRYAKWKYGLHPYDELIEDYIFSGSMYYCEIEGTIVSAVAITKQGEDYRNLDWSVSLPDGDISVVHIFAVSPAFQGCGIGRKTMNAILESVKISGKKAVRLDALVSNIPAQKLYESVGFKKVDGFESKTANAGIIKFFAYELVL